MADRDDKAKQLLMDYLATFDTRAGKNVLRDLRDKSTMDRSSISADKARPIDLNRLVYDEGQRAIMLYILRQLAKDPYAERPKRAKD